MKPFYQLILGLALAVSVLSQVQASTKPKEVELDRIVAIVNNGVITSSELDEKINRITQQLEQKNTQLPSAAVLRRQVLNSMILDEIQLQLAKASGIRVDDQQLNQVITNIAKQNSMTLEQFRTYLQSHGYPFARFRQSIRKQIIISRLRRNKINDHVYVSEQEVDNQLKKLSQADLDREYHLAQILIPLPESAGPNDIDSAGQKANNIYAQLSFGADFAKTAVSVSGGQHALQGGDLGWVKQGQLPTIFANVIPDMKPGEITKPLRSASGFHIIKLIATRTQQQKHVVIQTLARHILIKTSAIMSNTQARQKLERLRKEILAGKDFGTVARASSDDTASAANGGSLGWINPGTMVPEFQAQMDQLKPGQISQPFETRFGWHIVQVLSRRKIDNTKAYMREQAREQIRQRKVAEDTENWLRRIRDQAYVKIIKQ